MASSPTQSVGHLFAELNRHGQSGEYSRALKAADKILSLSHGNEKAFHCKVVCLIQIGKFEETLALLKKNPQFIGVLAFEKAYCEYRLNRTNDARKTLEDIEEPDLKAKELLGQVLYRLEEYGDCLDVYKDLVRNSQDDYEEERQTNMAAVVAALQASQNDPVEDLGLEDSTHELAYNKACLLCAQGKYQQAEEKLKMAEEICRANFEDDPDMTDDDIDSELGAIRLQLGYVLQKQGKPDAALKLYNMVLKQRPDAALTAVASNNAIVINKDQNMFDSRKKIKAATLDSLKHKLTSAQQKVIALNQCLLYLYMNQGDQCHLSAEQLRKKYPADMDVINLIEAAQFCKDKSIEKSTQLLSDQLQEFGQGSVSTKLSLAQLFLSQGKAYAACDVLKEMGELSKKPGMVSTLVSLYISMEDMEGARDVLEEALEWHKENQPNSSALKLLMKASARFYIKQQQHKEAAQVLEELRRGDPKDLKVLAQLITAYSKFDNAKAQLVSRDLPSAEELAADVDIEALEATGATFGPKYIKKAAKPEQSPGPTSPGSGPALAQKKKKKVPTATLR